MADDPRVTHHALVRYLERVICFPVDPIRAILAAQGGVDTDHAIIQYIECRLGLDLDPQRAEIVAITATGRATGAPYVVSGRMTYVLSSCGKVITVQPHPGKTFPRATGRRMRHKENDQ